MDPELAILLVACAAALVGWLGAGWVIRRMSAGAEVTTAVRLSPREQWCLDVVRIADRVKLISTESKAVICLRDCYMSYNHYGIDRAQETVKAWEIWCADVAAGRGETNTQRFGLWVPAIPL